MQMIRHFLASACLAACVVGPAMAQSGAPIRQGVTSQDLSVTTQQIQQDNADLRLRVSDMQREINALNGKVETLEFLLGQTRDEINRMQGDDIEIGRTLSAIEDQLSAMDSRMDSLNERIANVGTQSQSMTSSSTETGGTRTVTVRNPDGSVTRRIVQTPGPAIETANADDTIADETQVVVASNSASPRSNDGGYLGTISASDLPGEAGALFTEAKSRLLQFDYAGAESAFTAFLQQFGDDPQAGEAQYWLGEVLYQQDQYAASGAAYTQMIQTYPQDPRAPDALVKLARSMRLIGESERACAALDALPLSYPDASTVTRNLAAVERTRSGCDT